MGIEELANKGIATIGDLEKSKEQTEKTIIIVGIGRGGTSLISGTLAHLGLFTGKRSISPVFEDIKLSKVMENKDFQSVRQIIDDYNRHPIWAFKRPSIINYLKRCTLYGETRSTCLFSKISHRLPYETTYR